MTDRPFVAILDYGIGNLHSAKKALDRAGADARLTADHDEVWAADGVVLPGVGAFGRCMAALREAKLEDLAVDVVGTGKPFLAICVGMQMLYGASDEDPGVRGIDLLPGRVRRLPEGVKRPQMQWNVLQPARPDSALLAGLPEPAWVYFVHSYAPEPSDDVVATCDYGGPVVAAIEWQNVWATQFHPEKSGAVGLRLLANFVDASRSARAR